jgi:hypothetical protein
MSLNRPPPPEIVNRQSRPSRTLPSRHTNARVHDRLGIPCNLCPPCLRIRTAPRRHALPSRHAPLVPAQALPIRSHILPVHVDVDGEIHLQYVLLAHQSRIIHLATCDRRTP